MPGGSISLLENMRTLPLYSTVHSMQEAILVQPVFVLLLKSFVNTPAYIYRVGVLLNQLFVVNKGIIKSE